MKRIRVIVYSGSKKWIEKQLEGHVSEGDVTLFSVGKNSIKAHFVPEGTDPVEDIHEFLTGLK
jgi:hypothetical protein